MKKIEDFVKHGIKEFLAIFVMCLFMLIGYLMSKNIIFLIFMIFVILCDVIWKVRAKKYLSSLSREEVNKINSELLDVLLTNKNWYLINSYILIRYPKFRIIKYEDVVLLYFKVKHWRRYNWYQSIVLVLRNGEKYDFEVDIDNDEDFSKCGTIIMERNARILVGKNKENKKILKDKYNIKL